jgi:hypothetical protein
VWHSVHLTSQQHVVSFEWKEIHTRRIAAHAATCCKSWFQARCRVLDSGSAGRDCGPFDSGRRIRDSPSPNHESLPSKSSPHTASTRAFDSCKSWCWTQTDSPKAQLRHRCALKRTPTSKVWGSAPSISAQRAPRTCCAAAMINCMQPLLSHLQLPHPEHRGPKRHNLIYR